jgi:hypothetical protein
MDLLRVYFGRRPGDLVHHLLVIALHPLFNFVVPICAKPNHGVLRRTHNEERHHLACKWRINVKVICRKMKEGLRTDPEAWETIPPMEGKRYAEG